jgi:hypothetical protein
MRLEPSFLHSHQYGSPQYICSLQKYRTAGQGGRRRGTWLWSVSSPAQDAALVAEAQRNPFANARDLKAATNFPGQKSTVMSRLVSNMTCCGEGCTYR